MIIQSRLREILNNEILFNVEFGSMDCANLVLVACISKLKIDISAHLSYHNSSYKNCLSNSRMPVTRNIKSSNSVLVEDISWDDYFKFNADLLCPAYCWLPPAHKSYLHSNQAIIYLKFTHFGNINNPSSLVWLDTVGSDWTRYCQQTDVEHSWLCYEPLTL